MKPIRVFLWLFSQNRQFEFFPYRDADQLVSHRSACMDENPEQTSLVHVGTGRPEIGDTIIRLLLEYPGKVLLTQSAKFALDPSISNSTKQVGSLEANEEFVHQSLHLALSGWGYEISDLPADDPQWSASAELPDVSPIGWLIKLQEEHPLLFSELANRLVATDSDYVHIRSELSETIQLEIDNRRFEYLRHTVDMLSPSSILAIAPKKILDTPVDQIPFTVRISNVLQSIGVQKCEQLTKYSKKDLLKNKNFGRKSLIEISQILFTYISNSSEPETSLNSELQDLQLSLVDEMENTFAGLKAQHIKVLIWRLGMSGKPLTLDKTGEKLRLTRERVRQIEKKVITNIITYSAWPKNISESIRKLLLRRSEPLYLEFLGIENKWFAGFKSAQYLGKIIAVFTRKEFSVVQFQGMDIISRLSREDWDDLVSQANSALKERVKDNWKLADVQLLIETLALGSGAPELRSLMFDALKEKLHFSEDQIADNPHLLAFGNTAKDVLVAILEEANTPLKFIDIQKRYAERGQPEISESILSNTLHDIDALLFSKGTYGLEKHFPIDESDAIEILLQTEQVPLDGPIERQWHTQELLKEIFTRNHDLPEILDMYLLNIILKRSDIMVGLGRFVWVQSQAGMKKKKGRIDLRQAVTSILERAGHPLRTEELRSEVSIYRGISELPLYPTGRVIQLTKGLWGLVDRDLGLTEEQREELLAYLSDLLTTLGHAVHLSELPEALIKFPIVFSRNFDHFAVLDLAGRDSRFTVGRGHMIGLSEWEGMRRMTISEACSEWFGNLTEPVTMETICENISKLVGRKVESYLIYNKAKTSRLVFDPEAKLWSPAKRG